MNHSPAFTTFLASIAVLLSLEVAFPATLLAKSRMRKETSELGNEGSILSLPWVKPVIEAAKLRQWGEFRRLLTLQPKERVDAAVQKLLKLLDEGEMDAYSYRYEHSSRREYEEERLLTNELAKSERQREERAQARAMKIPSAEPLAIILHSLAPATSELTRTEIVQLLDAYPYELPREIVPYVLGYLEAYPIEESDPAYAQQALEFKNILETAKQHFGGPDAAPLNRARTARFLHAAGVTEKAGKYVPRPGEIEGLPPDDQLEILELLYAAEKEGWDSFEKLSDEETWYSLIEFGGNAELREFLVMEGEQLADSLLVCPRSRALRRFQDLLSVWPEKCERIQESISALMKGTELGRQEIADQFVTHIRFGGGDTFEKHPGYEAFRAQGRRVRNLLSLGKTIVATTGAEKTETSRGAVNRFAGAWLEAVKNTRGNYKFEPPIFKSVPSQHVMYGVKDKIFMELFSREWMTSDQLLQAAPLGDLFDRCLPPLLNATIKQTAAELFARENRYREACELVRQIASDRPDLAKKSAEIVLQTFVLPEGEAGRSARAQMDVAGNRFAQFFQVVEDLNGIAEAGPLNRSLVASLYAQFSKPDKRRPYTRKQMEQIAGPMASVSEETAGALVESILKVLTRNAEVRKDPKERGLVTPAHPDKPDASSDDPNDLITQEFTDLESWVADWKKTHPCWRASMLHGRVCMKWAEDLLKAKLSTERHQKRYAEALQYYQDAGAQIGGNSVDEHYSLLSSWFQAATCLTADPAFKGGKIAVQAVFASIADWLGKLPQDVRVVCRENLARQLDAVASGVEEISEIQKRPFLQQGIALLGNEATTEYSQRMLDFYRLFDEQVEFLAEVDGSKRGERAPIGDGEFGVLLLLEHTFQARVSSGGFQRYLRNDLLAGPTDVPDAKLRMDYREDLIARVKKAWNDVFEVLTVEPYDKDSVPIPAPGRAGYEQTRLAYVILKLRSGADLNEMPAVQFDLDVNDGESHVVVPLEMKRVLLRRDPAGAVPTTFLNPEIEFRLNPKERAAGLITLEARVQATRACPPLAEVLAKYFDFGHDGFSMALQEDKIEKVDTNSPAGPRVIRRALWHLKWDERAHATVFNFPMPKPVHGSVFAKKVRYHAYDIFGTDAEKKLAGGQLALIDLPAKSLPARRSVLTGVAVALGVACVGLAVAWLLMKQRGNRDTPPQSKPVPPFSDRPNTFQALYLLRQILRDSEVKNGLNAQQMQDLRSNISRLEEVGFGRGNHDEKEIQDALESAVRWMSETRSTGDACTKGDVHAR